ncbi:hypothetical protein K523DRAFT_321004 [Schizophyllum commune Tattone D]|nr:hypothetical protein K523DRAFT_321004 [Schizophyllum commune Tattone D]
MPPRAHTHAAIERGQPHPSHAISGGATHPSLHLDAASVPFTHHRPHPPKDRQPTIIPLYF